MIFQFSQFREKTVRGHKVVVMESTLVELEQLAAVWGHEVVGESSLSHYLGLLLK